MSELDQRLLNALKDENNINLNLIRSYLDKGADVNAKDDNGSTLLCKAVWTRNIPLIKLLIEYQADPTMETDYESTPLYQAAYSNKDESIDIRNKIIKLLLEHGATVDNGDIAETTPLSAAAGNGNIKGIELLLSYGANINAANSYKRTPLHRAVDRNQGEVIKFLIDHGAIVDAADEKGFTPLYKAVKWGQVENTKLLISYGADVNIKDIKGKSLVSLTKNPIIREILADAIKDKRSDYYC